MSLQNQESKPQVKTAIHFQKITLLLPLLIISNIYLSSIGNWFMEILILDLFITIYGYKLFDRITLQPYSIQREFETKTLKKDIKKISVALVIIQAIKLITIFLLEYLK